MDSQLRKFMSAYKFWWTILTFTMVAFIIVFVICAIAGSDVNYRGLVVFIVILGSSLLPQYKSRKFYTELETSGRLTQAEADFERAVSLRKDKVRLGNSWIFVKGKERLLPYEDICQVYQYVHKTNFVEDQRSLKYVDKKGKLRVLCKLELEGKSDADAQKIVAIILSKNPHVKIGYR